MTFGGNMKQRVSAWAAVVFFVVAMLCAIESTNTSAPGALKAVALISMALGLISFVGVWTMGLTKSPDTNERS